MPLFCTLVWRGNLVKAGGCWVGAHPKSERLWQLRLELDQNDVERAGRAWAHEPELHNSIEAIAQLHQHARVAVNLQ